MENKAKAYGRYGLTGFLSVCMLLLFMKIPVWAAEDSFSVMQWNRELQALESHGKQAGTEIGTEQNVQAGTERLPASYDPRQEQMVTPVRDQRDLTLCWDYAGIALMESALLRKGYRGAEADLSELHGAYAAYCLQADGSSFSQFCRRTNTRTALFEAALAGMGPVLEAEVPMQQITDAYALPEQELYRQQYKVLSVSTQPLADKDVCKRRILQTGGLMISYYSYGPYYRDQAKDGDTSYYFPYATGSLNHTVAVVGWDDTYNAAHFVKTPQKDGAWLVKNSWGQKGYQGAGSGFYWISYEDGSLQKQLALSVQMSEKLVQDKPPVTESSGQEDEQEEGEKQEDITEGKTCLARRIAALTFGKEKAYNACMEVVAMEEKMTDEQFETYNKLLELIDAMIEKLPEKEQKEYKQKKKDILLKKIEKYKH